MQIFSVRFVSAIWCLTKKPKENQVYIQTVRSVLLVVNVSTTMLVVHMIVILTLCSAIVHKCSRGKKQSLVFHLFTLRLRFTVFPQAL